MNGAGRETRLPASIAEYDKRHDLALGGWPGPEAQVAAIADDIAYNHHDLDDGLRAGFFAIDDLHAVPHVAATFRDTGERYPGIEPHRQIHETVRRLIDAMVRDVLAEASRRLKNAQPGDVQAIRGLGHPVVAFSDAMGENDRALKGFLFENMYRGVRVLQETGAARRIVTELFEGLMAAPERLPAEWRRGGEGKGPAVLARLVTDYIAGMTDRYATQKHALLTAGQNKNI